MAEAKAAKQTDKQGILKEKFGDAREKLQGAYDTSKQKIEEVALKAKNQATTMYGDCKEFVEENPTKSVLIAAGVGLTLGVILGAIIARRR